MKWYHTYLLHPGLDKTEAMINQYLYWPDIREAVQNEITGYYTCQHTKRSTTKNGKLPAKLAEETSWNKLCVYIIGPYRIRINGKMPLILKPVTMIDPITGWFEVTQQTKKKEMANENLVETTWLVRYPWPVEIMYEQGG